jgi:cysteine desulfurase
VDQDSLYLDYNATSPLSESVKKWLQSGDFVYANPSAQHMAGKRSRKKINDTLNSLVELFSLSIKDQIFFHSGATEGLFTIFNSSVFLAKHQNRKLVVCYSPLDHAAVLRLKDSPQAAGVDFMALSHREDLSYDHEKNSEALRELVRKDSNSLVLYHHLWVHNETGFVSPLTELQALKSEFSNLFIHVDSVQAPGKILDWKNLSVGDYWTFSAHKFGSLKGIGFTIIKDKAPFEPLILGGGQQRGARGGTENLMGIESLKYALEDLQKINVQETYRLKNEFKDFLRQELCGIGNIVESKEENSNTIYFYFSHLSSDITLALFDLSGLMISAGSACSSGASKPSAVLTELKKYAQVRNGLRISFPFDLSEEILRQIIKKFQVPLDRIKKLS